MTDRDTTTRTRARAPGVGGVFHRMAVHDRVLRPDSERTTVATTKCTKGGCKLDGRRRMPGAGLSRRSPRKAPLGQPAFQPYWGNSPYGMIGGIEERSSRQGRSLAGCKSPYRQLPVIGRLAYPMRGEVTNRVLLGRKSPGCPAGVFAAVGTIWGASKLGGRNIMKYLQPRKSPRTKSFQAG